MDPRGTQHPLTFGLDGQGVLALPPVTGAAERAAAGDAQALLGVLIGPAAGRLTVGDRDRVLAGLYGDLYGWDVLADARCSGCQARYELRFSLKDLLASRQPDGSASGKAPSVPVDAARVRLPLVEDLEGGAEDLIARLTVEGEPPQADAAEAALEAADPALELDLNGTCPECDAKQAVPFSMSGFLGAALARDQRFLMREVHLIARSYGWSLESILGLTRAERQEFVRLILAEQGDGPAARSAVRRVS
ncbi:MAG: hypothetical protein AAGB15_06840 [Pseudomonadota bacterium]